MARITLYHVADLIGVKVLINKQTYMKYICLCILYLYDIFYVHLLLLLILDPGMHNVCLCLHVSLHL